MRRAHAGLALALSLALGACTLWLNDEFDALQGGDGPDASTARTDGADGRDATASGSSSGSLPDSGGAPDTGTEAGGGASFCSKQGDALFCDDFDDPKRTIEGDWPVVNIDVGATIAPSNEQAGSAPSSALVVMPPIGTVIRKNAYRGRTFEFGLAATKTKIVFGMSLYVDAVPTAALAWAQIAWLELGLPGSPQAGTRFKLTPNGTSFGSQLETVVYPPDGGTGSFSGNLVNLPFKTWTRIERTIQLGTNPSESILVDGKQTVIPLPAVFEEAASKVFVSLGFQYVNGPSDAYRIYVDDVVLRVE